MTAKANQAQLPSSSLLTLNSRAQFNTLLDARVLTADDAQRPAIIYVATDHDPVGISRKEFRVASLRYAQALKGMGIGAGDLVVIAHTQNLESIYAFWGAIRAGAIPSMFPTLTEKLDPAIYMTGMAELVRISGVAVILTTDDFAPHLGAQVTCPVVGSTAIKRLAAAGDGQAFSSPDVDAPQIALLQHSSGTTGLQKGVALSHQAVLNQLASYSTAIALENDDVIVSWLPLYHDMGLIAGFLLPLIQGLPLVLMSPFDWVRHPALLFRAIDEFRATLCWLPNFAYNHSARRIRQRDLEGLALRSMRSFINCSEPVRLDSHQQFLERFASLGLTAEMLGVSYAMAENTFAVSQTPPGVPAMLDTVNRHALEEEKVARPVAGDHPQAIMMVSCGQAINGTAVRVVAEDGRELPDRQVGELAVSSNCLLSGYYKRPDLDPFQDGWFLTGDMGYMVDGQIYVIGRSKDLIINAGKNVYPQDIEAIVNEVPGIHAGRAVVFGVTDEREGTELIAVVAEVQTANPAEKKAIGKRIRQEVSRNSMVTVSFVTLVEDRWLIKTSSGKISRHKNREKWLQSRKR